METTTLLETPIPVGEQLLAGILAPYKPHCRYLLRARVERGVAGKALLVGRGDFSIPESCYIDDTGHFNAVEYNICFNQLAYVSFGQGLASGLLPEAGLPYEEFKQRQLAGSFILRFSSAFKKAMDARRFEGQWTITRIRRRSGLLFVDTTCRFWDARGGRSEGDALLAFAFTEGAPVTGPADD